MRQIKIGSWTTKRFGVGLERTHRTKAIPADILRKTSWAEFKAGNWEHYTLKPMSEFRYFDGHERKYPHLVLLDHTKEPLFMLEYVPAARYGSAASHIEIQSIQRNTPRAGASLPQERDAKRRTDEFKAKTGMNPEDFLLSEFIHQNRQQLLRRVKMYLLDNKENHETVARIRDRFCRKKPDELREIEVRKGEFTSVLGYEVDVKKERVKWLLV